MFQTAVQDEFAVLHQLKFHKHISPYLKIGVRYHLVVAFCIIILTVYSTGCYDKRFKKAFLRHNLWCTDLSELEIYGVIFPDFKYKVNFVNLYIIGNYV